MCGVAGAFNASNIISKDSFIKQTNTLIHRGPDFQDIWLDSNNDCMLGHTRLSIIDLNSTGNQPMMSLSSRYVISFNGEIYNFLEVLKVLKAEHSNYSPKGTSDTEILLAAIEFYGLNRALEIISGMFSFILFDRKESKFFLVRDRAGEKPLYYFHDNRSIIAASELKFFKFLENKLQISNKSLSLFLAQGNIPAPFSIFKKIKKIMPGEYLCFSKDGYFTRHRYWDLKNIKKISYSEEELDNNFEKLFLNSVKQQMISDVPLGAFLSGGIDSSSVVAAMTEQSFSSINTISIGFSEKDYDESNRSKQIANYLGTNHEEYFVSDSDALRLIPEIPKITSEPFADSSIIPTYILTKYSRKNLKVCLSGDGGDELFGGYRRQIEINRMRRLLFSIPSPVRKVLHDTFKYLLIDKSNSFSDNLFKSLLNLSSSDDQLHKILSVIKSQDLRSLYFNLLFQFDNQDNLLKRNNNYDPSKIIEEINNINISDIEDIRSLDFKNYLSNDILVKVDRAAMANSLETRIPYLDRSLIEFAFSIDINHLTKRGIGKLPVRRFLQKRIPNKLLNQPKTGFGIPLKEWLRGPLKEWCENLIFSSENDFINGEEVKSIWNDFCNNGVSNHFKLWNVITFYAWHEDFYN